MRDSPIHRKATCDTLPHLHLPSASVPSPFRPMLAAITARFQPASLASPKGPSQCKSFTPPLLPHALLVLSVPKCSASTTLASAAPVVTSKTAVSPMPATTNASIAAPMTSSALPNSWLGSCHDYRSRARYAGSSTTESHPARLPFALREVSNPHRLRLLWLPPTLRAPDRLLSKPNHRRQRDPRPRHRPAASWRKRTPLLWHPGRDHCASRRNPFVPNLRRPRVRQRRSHPLAPRTDHAAKLARWSRRTGRRPAIGKRSQAAHPRRHHALSCFATQNPRRTVPCVLP